MRFHPAWVFLVGLATGFDAAAESAPAYAGQFGRTGNSPAHLWAPFGVCADNDGFIYVAELLGSRVQKWTQSGVYVARWGSEGAEAGQFFGPTDVALDAAGLLWVADRGNHRLQVIDRDGTSLAVVGAYGQAPGMFASPASVTVGGEYLYVADTLNNRVQQFLIRGTSLEFVRAIGDSGTAAGQLQGPQDVEVSADGRIWVADAGNTRIQVFSPEGVSVLRFGGSERGTPSRNYLGGLPYGLALDRERGGIIVTEAYRRRATKFSLDGVVVSSWGQPPRPKPEILIHPLHMCWMTDGRLAMADYDDQAHVDRVVFWSFAPTPVAQKSWSDVRRAFR